MRRSRRTSLPILIAALLAAGAAAWFKDQQSRPPRAVDGQVVAVIDGDTAGVMIEGREVRIRLYGIDAPEKGQAFGTVAKRELSARIFGRIVSVQATGHDRYGRTIARLNLDGGDVGLAIVRDGLAWWYQEYAKNDAELNSAEKDARFNRRGLWQDSDPVPPWAWRKAKNKP